MNTQRRLASLAALTAATLALPATAQDTTAPKCVPRAMAKCGAGSAANAAQKIPGQEVRKARAQ